ncbi:hypothetical protein C0J52_11166 [Blattella germanica]|nr:hypothetical protein C0J52_11166 [Blattella germanica]
MNSFLINISAQHNSKIINLDELLQYTENSKFCSQRTANFSRGLFSNIELKEFYLDEEALYNFTTFKFKVTTSIFILDIFRYKKVVCRNGNDQRYNWIPPRRKKRGRPRLSWNDNVRQTMDDRQMTDEDWKDRERWKHGCGRRQVRALKHKEEEDELLTLKEDTFGTEMTLQNTCHNLDVSLVLQTRLEDTAIFLSLHLRKFITIQITLCFNVQIDIGRVHYPPCEVLSKPKEWYSRPQVRSEWLWRIYEGQIILRRYLLLHRIQPSNGYSLFLRSLA